MMTPFERAVRGELEGSRGGRAHVQPEDDGSDRATPLSGTQLHRGGLLRTTLPEDTRSGRYLSLLEREDTFHSNALEPIGCLGVGRPPPRPVEVLKSLREAWKRADDKRVDVRGYLKQVRRPDGSSAEASDSVLAWDGSTETWFTRMSSGLLSRTGSTCATGTGRRAWLSPTLRI